MATVIFDWDGTIAESGEGITRSVQYALDTVGIKVPDLSDLTHFIGPPLRVEFKKTYGMSDADIEKAITAFRARYESEGIFECRLYPGIEDVLRDCVDRFGMSIAVASSKTDYQLHRLVKHFELDSLFDVVRGATPDAERPGHGVPGKSNKAVVIEETLSHLEMKYGELIRIEDTYMIGDTAYDMEGAEMQGIHGVGVTYGYGSRSALEEYGAETIVNSVDELYSYLSSLT